MIYKKSWKYILKYRYTYGLYKIKAVKDFSDIKKEDLGGFVRGYHNLSQFGDCWIYNKAGALSDARIFENAKICDYAQISGNARIYGNARVTDNARVHDDARVFGNARIYEGARIYGDTEISGNTEYSEIFQDEFFTKINTKENFLIKIKKWFIKKLGSIF